MATILIAYATREGQTAKVAGYLATGMRLAGHEVQLLDTDRPARGPDLGQVDAVVVAAPIHVGRYPRSIVRFVRNGAGAVCASTTNKKGSTARRRRPSALRLADTASS